MNWCILMSLFESVVFSNHMEIISSDDDSSGHLSGNDNTFNDSSSNGDITSEGALLVNVSTLDSFSGGLETETDISEISETLGGLGGKDRFALEGDTSLLVESSVNFCHFCLGA